MANAAGSQTPDDRLIAMGRAYVAFARANSAIYLLMFRHSQAFAKSDHLQTAAQADEADHVVAEALGIPHELRLTAAAGVNG